MTATEELSATSKRGVLNECEDSDLEEYEHMVNDAVTLLHERNRSPLEHDWLEASSSPPTESSFTTMSRRRFPLPATATTSTATTSNDHTNRSDICIFYQRGNCRYGTECRFRHMNTTTSTDKSTNTHRRSSDVNSTTYQLPIPCRYWISSGDCPWGEQCRYQHLTADALLALEHASNEEDKVLNTNTKSSDEYSHYDSDLLSENGTLLSESDNDDNDDDNDNDDDDDGHDTATSTTAVDTPNGLLQPDGLVSRSNGELEQNDTATSPPSHASNPPLTQRRRANTSDAGTSRATCRYWASSGRCRWLDRCRFQHDLETRGINQHQQDTVFFTDHAGIDAAIYNHGYSRGQVEGDENGLPTTTIDAEADPTICENEERGMCGFTADEVMELLAQGVSPWDEDAWRVMEALTIYSDDDYDYDDYYEDYEGYEGYEGYDDVDVYPV
ncbi:hypothetical protein BDF22DRAFT_778968 [Syncephalis plumigaleata]|nr:hypothetical protein BDF22DRAFT_778968 [Syncephalis plumigaleata]